MKGFRTLLYMALAALPPILIELLPVLSMPEFYDLIPDRFKSLYAVGVAVLGIYLRMITTTPVGQK